MEDLSVAIAQQQLINMSKKINSPEQQQQHIYDAEAVCKNELREGAIINNTDNVVASKQEQELSAALNLQPHVASKRTFNIGPDEHNRLRPSIAQEFKCLASGTLAAEVGEISNQRAASSINLMNSKNKKLFPQKLWDLINDHTYNFCLRWSDDGQLVYLNRDLFEDSYLKTNENQFHTQKAISFVRQMNMYGFRKVDDCYYENDNFKRGCEHLLRNMIRKHPAKNQNNQQQQQQINCHPQTMQPNSSSTTQQLLDEYCCGNNSNQSDDHHQQKHLSLGASSNLADQLASINRPSSLSPLAGTLTTSKGGSISFDNNHDAQQQVSRAAERLQLFSKLESNLNPSYNTNEQVNIFERLKSIQQAMNANQNQNQNHNQSQIQLTSINRLNENNQLNKQLSTFSSPSFINFASSFLQASDSTKQEQASLFGCNNFINLIKPPSSENNEFNNNSNNIKNQQSSVAVYNDEEQQRAILEAFFMAQQQQQQQANHNNLTINNGCLVERDLQASDDKSFSSSLPISENVHKLLETTTTATANTTTRAVTNKNNDINLNNFIYNLLSSFNPTNNLSYQNVTQPITKLMNNNNNNNAQKQQSNHSHSLAGQQQQQQSNLLLDLNKYSNLQQICQALAIAQQQQQQQQQQSQLLSSPTSNISTYNAAHDFYQEQRQDNNSSNQLNNNNNDNNTANNNLPNDNNNNNTNNIINLDKLAKSFESDLIRRQASDNNLTTTTTSTSFETTIPNILLSHDNSIEEDQFEQLTSANDNNNNNNTSLLSSKSKSNNSCLNGISNQQQQQQTKVAKTKLSGNEQKQALYLTHSMLENEKCFENLEAKNHNNNLHKKFSSNNNISSLVFNNKQSRENKPNRCFKRSIDSILDSNNYKQKNNSNLNYNSQHHSDRVCENKKIKLNMSDDLIDMKDLKDTYNIENNYCINRCAKNLVTQVALARDVKLNSNVIEEASIFTKKFVSILFETAQVIARHSTNGHLITNTATSNSVADSLLVSTNGDNINNLNQKQNTYKAMEEKGYEKKHDESLSPDINLSDLSSAIKLLPSKLLKILG